MDPYLSMWSQKYWHCSSLQNFICISTKLRTISSRPTHLSHWEEVAKLLHNFPSKKKTPYLKFVKSSCHLSPFRFAQYSIRFFKPNAAGKAVPGSPARARKASSFASRLALQDWMLKAIICHLLLPIFSLVEWPPYLSVFKALRTRNRFIFKNCPFLPSFRKETTRLWLSAFCTLTFPMETERIFINTKCNVSLKGKRPLWIWSLALIPIGWTSMLRIWWSPSQRM